MHNILHPKNNSEQLYLPKKEGGRTLLNAKDIVNTAILGPKDYIRLNKERISSAAKNTEKVTGLEVKIADFG